MNPVQTLYEQIENQQLWQKTLVVNRNEYVSVKGNVNTNIYYIANGSLRVFVANEEEDLTIRFGYQGNFIAALDAYITEKPSALYIQALKKTTLKVISKAKFIELIESTAENLKLWQSMLEGLIYQQMEREMDILISSPIARYQRILERSPQLFQEIPHKYIASYLRMTPETLSRIKSQH